MSLIVNKTMDMLPKVMAQSIQAFLPKEDAFHAMRQVCAKWHDLVPQQKLCISNSENFSDGHLASFKRKGISWTHVRFECCPKITAKTLEILPKATLNHLVLYECENIRDFRFLHSLSLTGLDLATVPIEDSDLQGLKMPSLTTLDLGSCVRLSDKCFNGVEFPSLQTLIYDGTIGESTLAFMQKLPLTNLSLAYCSGISDSVTAVLSEMSLKILNLAATEITDAGITALMKGSLKNTLTDLNLADTSITEKATSLLGTDLRKLDLSNCSAINNFALFFLSGELTDLYLNNCEQIDDSGLDYLESLPLQRLDISGCPNITSRGLERLPASIKQLSARNCQKISTRDLGAFKARRL